MTAYEPPGRIKVREKFKRTRRAAKSEIKKRKKYRRPESWAARTFPSEWQFITALRECLGLDPRHDIWHPAETKEAS